tara:strand:+ start:2548 stop:3027 length:480 start_codon:yes stop_codon:yes gene_type:complete
MNESTRKTMFSSATNEWPTPIEFYNKLDKMYRFSLDPCCTKESAKCPHFFTEEDDGLAQSWQGHTVFMNPPYGSEIKHWVKKAYEESQKHMTLVVALIPARTDTQYWHNYCMKASEIMLVKGRLKFGDGTGSAPFPSAVVVFGDKAILNPPVLSAIERT